MLRIEAITEPMSFFNHDERRKTYKKLVYLVEIDEKIPIMILSIKAKIYNRKTMIRWLHDTVD